MSALSDGAGLFLDYEDRTPFGSAVSGLCDELLTRSCAVLRTVVDRVGIRGLQEEAETWMPRIMGPRAIGALYERPDVLKESCVFPPAELSRLAHLRVLANGASSPRIEVGEVRGDLARWLGEWQGNARRPRAAAPARLFDALEDAGALAASQVTPRAIGDGATLVGHATVVFQRRGTRLVFDPLLLPRAADDEIACFTPSALAPTAVFVTHSHPDHFHLPTLLRLGADVPIYVPAVARESMLAIDMAARLRELGFTQVHTLAWGEEVVIGPFRVIALPFYGEQPTDSVMLHPEARNMGNVYLCVSDGQRAAVVADAGADAAGNMIALAESARARYGDLDVLFGGYRAWRVQPIRYLFSSIPRYLLFVPREQRTRWQKIMNDADDLVATATAWGATSIVPYANGGAPWFARIGLGPSPDRANDGDIDPDLTAVRAAVARARHPVAELLEMKVGDRHPVFTGDRP